MKRLQWHKLQNFSQPPLLPRPIKFKLHGLASRTFLPRSDHLAHVPLCCGSHPALHLHGWLSPSCPLILWTPQHFLPPAVFWDLISRPLSESTLPQVHWSIRFMGHFPWSCASCATTMGYRPEKSSMASRVPTNWEPVKELGTREKISQSFASWSFHLLHLLFFFSRPWQLLVWLLRDPLGSSASLHKFQNLDFKFYPPGSRDAFHHQLTAVPEKKLPSLLRNEAEKIRRVSEVWRRKDTNQRLCHSHTDRANTLLVFLKVIFCKKRLRLKDHKRLGPEGDLHTPPVHGTIISWKTLWGKIC